MAVLKQDFVVFEIQFLCDQKRNVNSEQSKECVMTKCIIT